MICEQNCWDWFPSWCGYEVRYEWQITALLTQSTPAIWYADRKYGRDLWLLNFYTAAIQYNRLITILWSCHAQLRTALKIFESFGCLFLHVLFYYFPRKRLFIVPKKSMFVSLKPFMDNFMIMGYTCHFSYKMNIQFQLEHKVAKTFALNEYLYFYFGLIEIF